MKTSGMMLMLTLALLTRAGAACDSYAKDICCSLHYPNVDAATPDACIKLSANGAKAGSTPSALGWCTGPCSSQQEQVIGAATGTYYTKPTPTLRGAPAVAELAMGNAPCHWLGTDGYNGDTDGDHSCGQITNDDRGACETGQGIHGTCTAAGYTVCCKTDFNDQFWYQPGHKCTSLREHPSILLRPCFPKPSPFSPKGGVFIFYKADGPGCANAVVARTGKIGHGPNAGGSCGISVEGIGEGGGESGGMVEALGCDSCGNLLSYRYGRNLNTSDPVAVQSRMEDCEMGNEASYDVRLLIPRNQNECKLDGYNRTGTVYTKAVWTCPFATVPCT